MNKQERAKVLRKIGIVCEWYDEMTGGEYSASSQRAQDLIEALDLEEAKK